jgi:hypothetical protein
MLGVVTMWHSCLLSAQSCATVNGMQGSSAVSGPAATRRGGCYASWRACRSRGGGTSRNAAPYKMLREEKLTQHKT